MNHPFSLEGKTALITGGATGLGLAMTGCMIQAGARVVVVGRDKAHFDENCAQFGNKALFFASDVAQTDATPALADRILAATGCVDILVNNAGNHCKKPIEEMEPADFSRVLQTHLVGSFALTRALLPQMRARKSGSVLFIASMTSYIGQPYVMGYSAAKSGVLGMVHTLSAEVAADGVRVNAIAPGWIDTPMYRAATDNDPPRRAKILGRIQMNRVGEPADIGWAAVYLCSDAAKYVTGVCLPVDGGALVGF
ncbi:SDR family NAD(P)-dependent oxidoreductase [Agathobaculum sp. Marseille-P7918]|uniref:SDR family NAD(P)-dependent oxidoreductase n=1 Tax=Agathobaculum sp. Marseille-P7918 TaxID=2479843 RepID=UPI000F6446DB|nr:SDR family NAD(P)-dependent oxidoreductase [Agathobaculum sp. Marseille-P7918]